MQSKATTVAAYLKELPEERREAMSKIRSLIRKAAPGVKESMNYGMAQFELGSPLLCLASQKNYMAIYTSCESNLVARFKSRLGRLNCGLCCARFRKFENLNLDVFVEFLDAVVNEHRKKRKA